MNSFYVLIPTAYFRANGRGRHFHEDPVSVGSHDVPVILQFAQSENGSRISEIQGANIESQRELNQIDTHDVYDLSLEPGEFITDSKSIPTDHQDDGPTVFPFSIYQPIREDKSLDRQTRNTNDLSNLQFDILSEEINPADAKKWLSSDEKFKYGTADSSIPASKVPCFGCGAHLHCQDSKLPGFTPVELFTTAEANDKLRELPCQRCYIMKKYDVALKVSVSPEDYPKSIAHLKNKKAIIILVVDLTDFPGSVWPGILNQLGKNKRIILVGNKIDLLPADSKYYLKRIEKSMVNTFKKKCEKYINEERDPSGEYSVPEIETSLLVSARTGYNVEVLIDKIYSFWKQNQREVGGDIYLIGTTNVGKSSLFNMLVDSDLCKSRALDRVNKAMVSPVPGTTLNLLKFPISRPDPSRLSQRYLRLRKEKQVFGLAEEIRMRNLRKTRDRKYSILGHPIGRTFNYHSDKGNIFQLDAFNINLESSPKSPREKKLIDPDNPVFAKGKWCYDTPGSVSEDQILNLLTQGEVRKTIAESLPIQPRSFTLKLGYTLFIGGLGRLDVLEGPCDVQSQDKESVRRMQNLLLTVFASDDLPIHIVRTEDADSFYEEALDFDMLVVPSTNNGIDMKRLHDFPKLVGKTLMVDGIGKEESSCDIVLSSAGWISCSPGVAEIFKVKAWTPGGRGVTIREPPFLPEAVKLRGPRIKRTPAFLFGKSFVPQQN